MRAYNVVRFKVKAGQEERFIAAHRLDPDFKGFRGGALIKTGELAYCFVGEWEGYDDLAAARDKMVGASMSWTSRPSSSSVAGQAVVVFEPSK